MDDTSEERRPDMPVEEGDGGATLDSAALPLPAAALEYIAQAESGHRDDRRGG